MSATLLTEEVRAYLHAKAIYQAPDPMGRAAFRYFARAIGDDNPLYRDPAAARAAGYRDVIAPPTLLCETNQYVDRPRDEEGYIGHLWKLPVGPCRQVRGGNAYEFFKPVYPDDVVQAEWEIVDMAERTSGSGAPMLIVTSMARYTNQDGELLATNTETLIYIAVPAAEHGEAR